MNIHIVAKTTATDGISQYRFEGIPALNSLSITFVSLVVATVCGVVVVVPVVGFTVDASVVVVALLLTLVVVVGAWVVVVDAVVDASVVVVALLLTLVVVAGVSVVVVVVGLCVVVVVVGVCVVVVVDDKSNCKAQTSFNTLLS